MAYFLQHFAKNWVKTLVHGTLHKKLLVLRRSQVLVVFHQMPYFLQHFSKNWVKTLVHGTLHKKLLVLGQNVSARYFAQKVASFEEIDMFWWFWYFLQHFAKNWVKTVVHGTLHKKMLLLRR